MLLLSLPSLPSSLSRRLVLSMAALGLAALGTVSALPGTAAAAQRGAEFVSIKGSAVNVREEPTTRSEVVKTLKKSGTWAQVQREGGQKGWIARRLAWGW